MSRNTAIIDTQLTVVFLDMAQLYWIGKGNNSLTDVGAGSPLSAQDRLTSRHPCRDAS